VAGLMERREALRPTSLGACAPKAVRPGNRTGPWAHRRADRKAQPRGVSQTPWRLPALHPPWGNGKRDESAPAPFKE